MEIFLSIITGLLSSAKAIELGVSLINRIIAKIDGNKELKKQWAITSRLLNVKTPVRLSDESLTILVRLDEEERLAEIEKSKVKEQLKNYEENNKTLYKENLELRDYKLKSDFKGEF